jgi:hypothetical protein
MLLQLLCSAILGLLITTGTDPDGPAQLQVIPPRGLGAIERVTVYRSNDEQRRVVAEVVQFDKVTVLPGEGPFEVFVKPKGGLPVRVVAKLTVKAGSTHELKLSELLGAVEVLGDDLPRADKVILTDPRDPGPGEKGHIPLQMATEYRVAMLVPPGMYAVWVVPANGAKAQRVEENVRVQAGRSVRVGE